MPPSTRKTPAKIALNLDTFEREDVYEPFVIVLDGHEIKMTDPAELDWQVLATMTPDRPGTLFRHVVPEEDKEHFRKANLPGWKMKALMQNYLQHFGIGDQGNDSDSLI